jgi:hypothetical protein
MTNVKHESGKAAQDAPPAPRCKVCDGAGVFVARAGGKPVACCCQPSPAHEALIAAVEDFIQAAEDYRLHSELRMHIKGESKTIAMLDTRNRLRDILTALKRAQ